MTEVKKKVVSVGNVSVKEANGEDGERRITFVASSNNQDRHYEQVDVASLRLPLKGGGEIKVSAIPEEGVSDVIDIPLMLNHSGDVRDVIGSVRKAFYQNGELIFECGVSSIEDAQAMLTLLEEGHLSNAFSITMCDYDYNFDSETISNAEIIEVSLVYRGANKEARLLAIKSLLGGEMPKEVENEKSVDAEAQTETITPTEEVTQPTDDVETEEKTTESEVAESEEAEESTEETKGETEAEETDKDNTKANKGESTMDETAKKQVVEKGATPTQVAATTDYLKTKAAVRDYAQHLAEYAGAEPKEVAAAWRDKVAAKGVTFEEGSEDALLPVAIVSAITDTLEASGGILATFDNTGLTVYRTAMNTEGDTDKGRAHGHKAGTTKKEEEIKLGDRVIRGQYIYKYLTLSKEDVRENQDTGALVTYALGELPKRVVREIERDFVIGDGRQPQDEDKVKSIISLKDDAADKKTEYVTTYTPAKGEPLYKSMLKAKAEIAADGDTYAVMGKQDLTEMRLTENNGGLVFRSEKDVADFLGVKTIFTPSWMNATNDKDNIAYIYVGQEAKRVGDKNPEAFTDFALQQNKHEYLEEIYIGVGMNAYHSAVAVKRDAAES